ncbi:Protein Piccolo [Manis pentadactyla]|nr:Protein Piccolo [Manis pentadactyla]
MWWLLAEDSLSLPGAWHNPFPERAGRLLLPAAPKLGPGGKPRRASRRPAAGGVPRRQRGRAASGFLLEPVSGAAAGRPGHVMPWPGGGQPGIQWQPAGAEEWGRPQLRAQSAGPGSAAAAPPLRVGPGRAAAGRWQPRGEPSRLLAAAVGGAFRTPWGRTRGAAPRLGSGGCGGYSSSPGRKSLATSPNFAIAVLLSGSGGREGQRRREGGVLRAPRQEGGHRLPVPRARQQVQRAAQLSTALSSGARGLVRRGPSSPPPPLAPRRGGLVEACPVPFGRQGNALLR